uniref:uncharacterized protein LOC120327115 n=1 Tax=Styela clava TaxID=7725 RepID=UPI00193AB07A|nr:uncharacterized protein LOC120327115 [Styela clava]
MTEKHNGAKIEPCNVPTVKLQKLLSLLYIIFSSTLEKAGSKLIDCKEQLKICVRAQIQFQCIVRITLKGIPSIPQLVLGRKDFIIIWTSNADVGARNMEVLLGCPMYCLKPSLVRETSVKRFSEILIENSEGYIGICFAEHNRKVTLF